VGKATLCIKVRPFGWQGIASPCIWNSTDYRSACWVFSFANSERVQEPQRSLSSLVMLDGL